MNKPFLIVRRNYIPEAFFIVKDKPSLEILEAKLRESLTNSYDEFLNFYDFDEDTHFANAYVCLAKEDPEAFMEIANLALKTSFDNIPKITDKVLSGKA